MTKAKVKDEADQVAETVEGSAVEEPATDVKAEDYKPSPGELVARDREDVYRVMDRADEELILDEIQGRALATMVYSFEQDGRMLTDLSIAGVREVVRILNRDRFTRIRVHERDPIVQEVEENGKECYRVSVYAIDDLAGSGMWGTATEPKKMQLRNNRSKDDKFAFTKALNKAQRNALGHLIPVEFRETIKAQFLGDESKVRRIRAGAVSEQLAELPPPLDDAEARGLKQQARDLYGEIKELGDGRGRVRLTPGQFNAYLTRAEHSHDRLRDFLGHLEQRRDEIAAEFEAEVTAA